MTKFTNEDLILGMDVSQIELASEPVNVVPTVHPWIRLFARNLDGIFSIYPFIVLLAYFFPAILDLGPITYSMLLLFVWIFAETLFLSTWGTTPAKWLFNIQIRTHDGKKIRPVIAFKRSVKVWFFGWGGGVPIVSIFTLISAHSTLHRLKVTSWDHSEKLIVLHKPMEIYKKIILTLLICGYLAFAYRGALVEYLHSFNIFL
jgi:hypothetical protein